MFLRNISSVVLVAACTVCAMADNVRGRVTDKDGNPVIGANVIWDGTTKGAVTNYDGDFEIETSAGSNSLKVSYIGFQPQIVKVADSAKSLNIVLAGEVALEEVVVSERKVGTMNSRIETIQTQKIGYEELCRAACCNLAESFDTNASVDVSYSDAATGARQIKLLGLAGTYVQMLTEQLPNLQGAASPYGLGYVPGQWMESIQVSKGTSSVKNGYEALTGQINIEYKKPQTSDPLSVNLFAANSGRYEGNADANIVINDKLATGILAHYSQEKGTHDANDDGFLDLPKTEQVNLMNRWYYKGDKFIHQTMANVVYEDRQSGQTNHNGDILNPYTIGIETNRAFVFTKNGYIFNREKNTSLAFLASGTYHNQESHFGSSLYDVNQKNLYANLIFETEFTEKHKISTGASVTYDYYKESVNDQRIQGLDNLRLRRNETVGGAYFQYTYSPFSNMTLLAGIRYDRHSEYGDMVTPRMHLKFEPFKDYLSIRGSVGKGYRVANLLVENSYLLASSRVMKFSEGINPLEEAWNYGASAHLTVPVFGKQLSVMFEYYYTDFIKQVVADMEDPRSVSFYNLDGKSYSENMQIEVSYPFFRGFTLTGAYRTTDARTTYNGVLKEKPLTNQFKGLLTASYQTRLKKWQFDVTGQFNGKGRMPDPGAEALWDEYFPTYFSMSAQVTKYFKTWSIYVGGENLTGYRQKNPIIDPSNPWGEDSRFDASMVWGPMHGSKYYVGIRWSLSKD